MDCETSSSLPPSDITKLAQSFGLQDIWNFKSNEFLTLFTSLTISDSDSNLYHFYFNSVCIQTLLKFSSNNHANERDTHKNCMVIFFLTVFQRNTPFSILLHLTFCYNELTSRFYNFLIGLKKIFMSETFSYTQWKKNLFKLK